MPLQNRVDPWGNLVADPARGAWMGNRGCLHDDRKRLGTKRWVRPQWVICSLRHGDRHRPVMAPGRYTELFFLDEATALAAGHRPCATCRREAFNAFVGAWRRFAGGSAKLEALDATLHAQRAPVIGRAKLPTVHLRDVLDGCLACIPGADEALLVWRGRTLAWSFQGYSTGPELAPDAELLLITPRIVRDILAAGYEAQVHPSAELPGTASPRAPRVQPVPALACASEPPASMRASQERVSPTPIAATPSPVETTSMKLHRLATTPSGKELHAYFAAVLQLTGMDKGASFPLKRFFSNFSGHISAGRIEKCDGGYRLTTAGQAYFADRIRASGPQSITQLDVDRYRMGIRNGGAGWLPLA